METIEFDEGEVVRIVDGPYVDFNAVVEKGNYEGGTLTVVGTIFDRLTPLLCDFSQCNRQQSANRSRSAHMEIEL